MISLETRERLRAVLADENGLPPTHAATEVIVAVIEETVRTDENHDGKKSPVPDFSRYAIDAERILRIRRKHL